MVYFLLISEPQRSGSRHNPGPAKQGPKGEKMMQRENKRQSRHKAPKFKEAHEEDLCWEDRQEIQNHKKKSGKRSYQKTREKTKW